jgi:ABC-type nitrate/sulfonate/bicarbonate transport system permease component
MADESAARTNIRVQLRPIAFIAVLLVLWSIGIRREPSHLLPGPWGVVGGIVDLVRHGLLLKYVVASLFRVTWGFAWRWCWPFRWVLPSAGTAGPKWR